MLIGIGDVIAILDLVKVIHERFKLMKENELNQEKILIQKVGSIKLYVEKIQEKMASGKSINELTLAAVKNLREVLESANELSGRMFEARWMTRVLRARRWKEDLRDINRQMSDGLLFLIASRVEDLQPRPLSVSSIRMMSVSSMRMMSVSFMGMMRKTSLNESYMETVPSPFSKEYLSSLLSKKKVQQALGDKPKRFRDVDVMAYDDDCRLAVNDGESCDSGDPSARMGNLH
uniref:Mixed lineage kinase domain-containing protein n=1 Tax=Compsopogon caeruleus TaxID=31354 RepID=A0A7S1TAG3_9RHOD|mmetsp:Transcript_13861/g.28410  ORF Transcript_13861/g.28410 Transcript_13861/m.28410 type:complete len:233 (+) Transcript_13861:72-770(+)